MNNTTLQAGYRDVPPATEQRTPATHPRLIENTPHWGKFSTDLYRSMVREAAQKCLRDGLSLIPLKPRTKQPKAAWKQYARRMPRQEEVSEWFSGKECLNVGVVCGAVSGNLVVIDFDTEDAIKRYRDWIEEMSSKTLTVSTGRGLHVFLRTREAVRSTTFEGGDVKAEGSYVAFPPSLHPQGAHYAQVSDGDTNEILQWPSYTLPMVELHPVSKLNGPAIHDQDVSSEVTHESPTSIQEFSGELRRFVRHNERTPSSCYKSRSEAEMAVVVKLAAKGYSLQDLEDFFESNFRSRAHYKSLKGAERKRYLSRALRNAIAYLADRKQKTVQAREIIQKVLACCKNTFDFQGRTRRSDSVVLRHVLTKTCALNIFEKLAIPVRETAEQTGLSRTTTQKALRRLCAHGLILRVPTDTSNGTAALFNVNIAKLGQLQHISGGGDKLQVSQNSKLAIAHDAFRHKALGKNGHAILSSLINLPGQSLKEISANTGGSYSGVSRKLKQMMKSGIVIRDRKRYSVRDNFDLDGAARIFGTSGQAAVQKAFHNLERKQHIVFQVFRSGELTIFSSPETMITDVDRAFDEYQRSRKQREILCGMQPRHRSSMRVAHSTQKALSINKEVCAKTFDDLTQAVLK